MHLPLVFTSTICMALLCYSPAEGVAIETATIVAIIKAGYDIMKQYAGRPQTPISTRINSISSQLNNIEFNLTLMPKQILENMKSLLDVHLDTREFYNSYGIIKRMYTRLQKLSKSSQGTEEIREFAEALTDPRISQLSDALTSMADLLNARGDSPGLYNLMLRGRESKSDAAKYCEPQSIQQKIFQLHTLMVLSMVKGYTMLHYGFDVLQSVRGANNYRISKENVKSDYTNTMTAIQNAALDAMSRASRDVRRCDPPNHVEGTTYLRLKWLFNYVVISSNQLGRGCPYTCGSYRNVPGAGKTYSGNDVQCEGTLVNCQEFARGSYCPATKPYRNYDGFPGHFMLFGDNVPDRGDGSCKRRENFHEESNSPSSVVFPSAGIPCHTCLCFCDYHDHPQTLRRFSANQVESDIRYGKVVTGLRLVERKGVIHIQVQHGKLMGNGVVNASSVTWKPLQDPSSVIELGANQHLVIIDTLSQGSGRVLVSAYFAKNGNTMGLRIKTAGFNYATGALYTSTIAPYSNQPLAPDGQLHLDADAHIPTLGRYENTVNINDGTYLAIGQTNFKKDAGQTTIPFIDIQEVVTNPPSMLSGAGIYYKSQPGYGGFIALKLVTYDYKEFARDMPEHS